MQCDNGRQHRPTWSLGVSSPERAPLGSQRSTWAVRITRPRATGSAFERTPWLKGCLRLELADHRVGSLEEPPALGGADRLARDEPLAQGVHELSVLRHPVVQVRPGGEPGRADVADDLALADSHATPHARGDLREGVVLRCGARWAGVR